MPALVAHRTLVGAVLVPDSDLVLVHELVDARALEREVIGDEIWRARLRQALDRHTHARAPWQPRTTRAGD